jgi:hypothetical protein
MSITYNNRPSVHKIYQHLPMQDPPNFTQIWIFGLKTNHLATLLFTSRHIINVRWSVLDSQITNSLLTVQNGGKILEQVLPNKTSGSTCLCYKLLLGRIVPKHYNKNYEKII